MKPTNGLFLGVDVGTGSARAALVSDTGKILSVSVRSIRTWNPSTDHYEQSSDNIWDACVETIKVSFLFGHNLIKSSITTFKI